MSNFFLQGLASVAQPKSVSFKDKKPLPNQKTLASPLKKKLPLQIIALGGYFWTTVDVTTTQPWSLQATKICECINLASQNSTDLAKARPTEAWIHSGLAKQTQLGGLASL